MMMTCENENCANIFTLSVLGEKTQKNENLKGRIFFCSSFLIRQLFANFDDTHLCSFRKHHERDRD